MNNERRHELQQNELSDQLDKAKTWIEPYVVPILIGVIGVMVVGIGYNFIQSQRSSARSSATMELMFSTMDSVGGEDAEAYDRVTKNFEGTAAAEIAQLAKADIYLSQGIDSLFRDRAEAETLLNDALVAYEKVLETATVGILKSRAQYGLAQTYESQGNLEAAIAAYEKLVAMGESEEMSKVAKSRIALLQQPETVAFAAWFAQQQPTAFDPVAPPGAPNSFGIPSMPDIQLPGVSPIDAPAAEGQNDRIGEILGRELGSGNAPMTENGDFTLPQRADAAPATEPPATEPPVTEVPPVDTPPAETPPAADGNGQS